MPDNESSELRWFSVRCVFSSATSSTDPGLVYEERITLWRAKGADEAIAAAEQEAGTYAENTDVTFLGLAQCFELYDEPGEGAEVYSLMRTSALPPSEYLDRFFDTGEERQQRTQ